MEETEVAFKKPTFIGKVGKLPRKLTNIPTKPNESTAATEPIKDIDLDKDLPVNDIAENFPDPVTENKPVKPTNNSQNPLNPYKEPKWSQVPGSEEGAFSFEIIKSGVILETIQLNSKAFWTFGRLPDCDIIMAHPTISRYHAVLQYRPIDEDNRAKGWYIFDLNSTHGTFLNKNKVPPKSYVHVKPGFILKLGGSTRNYILQGVNTEDVDNEMTITDMIQQKQEMKLAILKREEELRKKKEEEANAGIDWGMGEDAEEDADLSENPFAMTNNEELFLDDPKKTLRGFFEREGLDLVYDVEDKGPAHFVCRVELPIDDANGRPITAECSHHGKKKEVVVQCALEACRILDRMGVLRQSSHEPRKRKQASSESEEDDFLDRTGDIERKKLKKIQQQKKKPVTYDELLSEEKELLGKVTNLESKLTLSKRKATTDNKDNDNDNDALDSFMSQLQEEKLDNVTKRKMMVELKQLKDEHIQLQKLIKIAQPNKLPDLEISNANISNTENLQAKNKKIVYPLFGKRSNLKKKNVINSETQILSSSSVKCTETKDVSEHTESTKIKNVTEDKGCTKIKGIPEDISEQVVDNELTKVDTDVDEKNSMNITNKELQRDQISIKPSTTSPDVLKDIIKTNLTVKANKPRRNRFRDRTKDERSTDFSENIDELGEKYNTWVPPEGQTGDGKTKLNEKFGY